MLDEQRQFGFLKAELFVALPPPADVDDALERMLARQEAVFASLASLEGHPAPLLQRDQVGSDQVDLTLAGIEVGSYGYRFFEGRRYLYGTALALPRLVQALEAAAPR